MSEGVTIKIVKHIGVIGRYPAGWTKELNRVSWNDGPVRLDVREWSGDHKYVSGGTRMTDEEGRLLMELLRKEFNEHEKGERDE